MVRMRQRPHRKVVRQSAGPLEGRGVVVMQVDGVERLLVLVAGLRAGRAGLPVAVRQVQQVRVLVRVRAVVARPAQGPRLVAVARAAPALSVVLVPAGRQSVTCDKGVINTKVVTGSQWLYNKFVN